MAETKTADHYTRRGLILAIALLALTLPCAAQSPFNSDALTERGVSPRVIDVAVSPLSQDLRFEMAIELRETVGGTPSQRTQGVLVFDPFTHYGLDLYLVLDASTASDRTRVRESTRFLESMLAAEFSLRAEDRLYDPKSLQIESAAANDTIIAFRFDRMKTPHQLRYLSKLSGTAHFREGRLDRIELTSDAPFRHRGTTIERLEQVVRFARVPDRGGYLVDSLDTVVVRRGSNGVRTTEFRGWVERYGDARGNEIAWERGERPMTEPIDTPTNVRLNLARRLPLLGNAARREGFQLPKPWGIGLVAHAQEQTLDIDSVSVRGIDVGGGDVSIIETLGSKADNEGRTMMVRGDVWVLPFLNVELVAGSVETDSEITLRFTTEFRNLVKLVTGRDPGEAARFPVETTGTTVGIGMSTGFQYQQLFGALSAQFVTSTTNEINKEVDATVATLIVGYDFGDIGLRIQTGAQYQHWDQRIDGTISLGPDVDPLDFDIGLSVDKTTFLVGFHKEFGDHWNAALLAGAGARRQITFTAGYRF